MHSIKALSFILVLQLALVLGFSWSGNSDLSVFSSDEPVFSFAVDAVHKITVEAADETLAIEKNNDGWQLPVADNFPGDGEKINGFLDTVLALKKSWPVATSRDGLKPLQVADTEFERKITFSGKDDTVLATLYLGTSPGFKKVYARSGDSFNVYSIEMSTFELPATPDAWTEKDYLFTELEQVAEISLPALTLVAGTEGFTLTDIAEGEEALPKEIDALVTQVTKVRFAKVLGIEPPAGYDTLEEEVAFSLKLKDGSEKHFLGKGLFEESFYILKEASLPFYFKVSKGIFERLAAADRAGLIKSTAAEADTESVAESESEAALEVDNIQ